VGSQWAANKLKLELQSKRLIATVSAGGEEERFPPSERSVGKENPSWGYPGTFVKVIDGKSGL
jgi:hypothetical protein